MLKLILVLLPVSVILAGQQPAASTAKTPGPVPGVPAGAVKIDEHTYRFEEKDASGKPVKVWLYRLNPFGASKIEEPSSKTDGKEAAPVSKPPAPQEIPIKVVDLGDTYRFELPSPFGAKVWTRKKSDLNAEERGLVEKSISSQKSVPAQKVTN
jgi:hypothetical protein